MIEYDESASFLLIIAEKQKFESLENSTTPVIPAICKAVTSRSFVRKKFTSIKGALPSTRQCRNCLFKFLIAF